MPVELNIRLEYSGALGITKREFNGILKGAYIAGVTLWHSRYRKHHFTVAGGKRYGYKPRKGEEPGTSRRDFFRSYTGRKLRTYGHRRPLVKTGLTEKLSRERRISGTSKKGVVRLPAGLNRRHPLSQINMADEATRIAPNEARQMVTRADRTVEKGYRDIRRVKRQTIKA